MQDAGAVGGSKRIPLVASTLRARGDNTDMIDDAMVYSCQLIALLLTRHCSCVAVNA